MKYPLLFIFIIFTYSLSAQDISLKTDSIINSITKGVQLDYSSIGVAGETSSQYLNFEKLKETATREELLALLNHKNSVVKGYAIWCLVDSKYENLKEILIQFIKTGEKVTVQNGCNVFDEQLATELYNRVINQSFYNKLSKTDSLFFSDQHRILDQIMYYFGKDNIALFFALGNNKANPENYTIIHKLAFEKKNNDALVEIAKYQKKADIEAIKKEGKRAFAAISYFPNPEFWDFLMQYKGKEMSLHYFLAVASFKNNRSLISLSLIYTMLKKSSSISKITLLDEALIKQYSPIYKDLIYSIFEDYKTIDLTITKKLLNEDPAITTKHFIKGLLSNRPYNFLEIDYNYGTNDSILPLILNNVKKYQFEKLSLICKKNITVAQFTDLTNYLDLIKSYKLTECNELLLCRLKHKNSPFEIYHIVSTLLSFHDQKMNTQVIIELRKTKKDWNEGNWADAFKDLFIQYRISV